MGPARRGDHSHHAADAGVHARLAAMARARTDLRRLERLIMGAVMAVSRGSLRLGFDIGGTFTDFVLLDPSTGALTVHKRLTTPDDPARGAIAGLDELLGLAGASYEEVDIVVHGTTIVTNAVIERKGRTTALL